MTISPLKSLCTLIWYLFSFLKFLFYLFVFGCAGSPLLLSDFVCLQPAGPALHFGTEAPHSGGFSCCGAWAVSTWASAVVTHGLVALQHVGFSQIRDGTCVTCIGRQTLIHWAIREVQTFAFLIHTSNGIILRSHCGNTFGGSRYTERCFPPETL